jgi:hypothetical protein
MASEILNQVRTFTTGTVALAAYVRVKQHTDGTLLVAGAGERAIGITLAPSAIGALASVRLLNGYGTSFMLCSAATAAYAAVYGVAAGKIDDAVAATNAGAPLGFALEAATADGDVIEVLLMGGLSLAPTASADQAVPTDLATSIAWITNVRLALIANGTIKGAA